MQAMIFCFYIFRSCRMTLLQNVSKYENICMTRVVCNRRKMKCMLCIFHNDNSWMLHASHNKSNSAGGFSYMTGRFSRGQEIPSKSKQTGGGPALVYHLRFWKGRRFIYRNFRCGTWRGTRGITRVSVCVSCTLVSKLFG